MSFFDYCAYKGMKVVMKMDKEARSWGRKGPPDGATGTLLQRIRHLEYRQHFGLDRVFSEPGVFERDGTWIVLMDNPEHGEVIRPGELFRMTGSEESLQSPIFVGSSDFDVHPDDQAEYDRRFQEFWHKPVNQEKTISSFDQQRKLDNCVRIGDLPLTNAFQLDTITFKDGLRDEDKDLTFVVRSINYSSPSDGNDVTYNLDAVDADGRSIFSTMIGNDPIKAIHRGNLWKHLHDQPVDFKDIGEEADFARGLGGAVNIPNPASGLYSWTLDEFLDAVQNDVADCMTNGFIPFTDRRAISVYRYKDRDLGERLRQTTMGGFAVSHRPAMV